MIRTVLMAIQRASNSKVIWRRHATALASALRRASIHFTQATKTLWGATARERGTAHGATALERGMTDKATVQEIDTVDEVTALERGMVPRITAPERDMAIEAIALEREKASRAVTAGTTSSNKTP